MFTTQENKSISETEIDAISYQVAILQKKAVMRR